jgi:hypothetical protein
MHENDIACESLQGTAVAAQIIQQNVSFSAPCQTFRAACMQFSEVLADAGVARQPTHTGEENRNAEVDDGLKGEKAARS